MVNFLTWILDCDSHSPAFLDLFISSGTSICSTMAFSPMGKPDHVISVSIDLPINLKQDAPFHHIVYNFSYADWDGFCDYLRDVLWEDIFRFSFSAAVREFCDMFRLELMYVSLLVSIRSNLTHLSSLCAAAIGNSLFLLEMKLQF